MDESSQPSQTGDSKLLASLLDRVAELERQVAELKSAPLPLISSRPSPLLRRSIPPPVPEPVSPSKSPPRSLEDRLGAQVFNRVGIVAILFGTSWFLKLAFEHNWVGPIGRILIGLLAGAALILWSESFRRKQFSAFSYSLKALGSGVLYLTLWAAFHLYHLLPASAALGTMILVTAWNAWMAATQDSELLAFYALAGGLATPLLLSTGGDHETFLFTYLLALDLAIAALLRVKPWSRLLLAALPATIAYFIAWYAEFFVRPNRPLAVTSLFVCAFFAAFTLPTLLPRPAPAANRSDRLNRLLTAIPLLVIFANAAFVSLALYSVLEDTGHHGLLPWLMVALAAVYLALQRVQRTPEAAGIHLSLAVTFLTIAIPLKANGRWITVAWLAEGVALLWIAAALSRKAAPSGDSRRDPTPRLLRLLASAALALGFCGAISLPFWLDHDRTIAHAFLNARFATALTAILAFSLAAYLARTTIPPAHRTGLASILAINLLALQAGVNEIETFWNPRFLNPENVLQTALSISAFLMLFGAALLAVGFWQRSAFIRWQGLILLVLAISKVFLYDVRSLSQGYRVASFLGLGILLMAVSFAYQKDLLSLRDPAPSSPQEEPE